MLDLARATARVTAFVTRNWVALAATAWRDFMLYGRGVILLSWGQIEAWEHGGMLQAQPPYMTDEGDDAVAALLARYRPETSIVLGVASASEIASLVAEGGSDRQARASARLAESFGVWVFDYDPPPPMAHAKAAH